MAKYQASPIETALHEGKVTISDPVSRWSGRMLVWEVTIVDTESGERLVKAWSSEAKAKQWISDQWVGVAALRGEVAPAHRATHKERHSSVLDDDDADDLPYYPMALPCTAQATSGDSVRAAYAAGGPGTAGRFRLKGAKDALAAAGYDPFVAIAKVLVEETPVMQDGAPLVDHEGAIVMTPVLDAATRAKVGLELAKFVQPTLKAVEHRIDDAEQTVDQIDRQIENLLTKQARAKARDAGGSSDGA